MISFRCSSESGLTSDPIAKTFIRLSSFQTLMRCSTKRKLVSGPQDTIVANANFEVIHAMRIAVLALEGLFDSGLTVTLDAFSTANSLAAKFMGGRPRFDLTIVGVRRKVRSMQGL